MIPQRVEIRMVPGGRATVLVDGDEVRGLVAVSATHSIDQALPFVTVSFLAREVVITADEAEVTEGEP